MQSLRSGLKWLFKASLYFFSFYTSPRGKCERQVIFPGRKIINCKRSGATANEADDNESKKKIDNQQLKKALL